ncbi:arylsulfatase [Flavihumibacter sp. RY-1]|uniref:Arylsulfatase n=1 Tax=Flavihumibacter fluminis TaxID=2909236 RepID=A0ABS9BP96_9BACT|nr:arylsulfatase [Flavihumibacter fluminis]MCF1716634.1 arylsulfatase [Flavihumibacter fluminis]
MKNNSRLFTNELLFLMVLLLISFSTVAQQKNQPPNIIYILADDLGYGDLGCYGQTKIKTPNIDQLAVRGKKFTSFYAGSTVCAPSRAALITGLHTGHVSVRGNGEFPLPKEEKILPEYLKEKGYVNGMMGKWGLGLPTTSGSPEQRGWDYFSGHVHHVEGHYQHPDSAWQIQGNQLNKIRIPGGQYANEWFTNEALNFIRNEKDRPFFLYLSFTLPHAELVVPDQFLRPYLNANGESLFAPETAHAPGQHYGPQAFPKAAYAAMITQMDSYVGKVVDEVSKLGLTDNTIIIFTSDNGTHQEGGRKRSDAMDYFKSSGPLKGIKRDLYEGGIRVPFIVQWPGVIEAGTSTDLPAANWDIVSTFCSLAGIQVPDTDGISLAPVWLNKARQSLLKKMQNRPFYWEFYEQGYKQAVRKGNWKAIRYYQGVNPVRTELYNLETDPGENKNLSSANQQLVKELEAEMEKLRKPASNPAFQIK